tara:strand:- start:2284 stop:2610 length:327 start_codon:yes stop_codon:yes gene_type:complete
LRYVVIAHALKLWAVDNAIELIQNLILVLAGSFEKYVINGSGTSEARNIQKPALGVEIVFSRFLIFRLLEVEQHVFPPSPPVSQLPSGIVVLRMASVINHSVQGLRGT